MKNGANVRMHTGVVCRAANTRNFNAGFHLEATFWLACLKNASLFYVQLRQQ